MGIFTRRPPARTPGRARVGHAVTASARQVDAGTSRSLKKLSQPWQRDALTYYDTIGECWYPAQFYARSFPRIRFFPAILDEKGDPQEVETGPLVEAFERIRDPGGTGHTELTSTYGRLQWLIGDGYLVVSEQDDEEAWEYLSPLELRVKPDTVKGKRQEYVRLRAPGVDPEELSEAPDDDFEPVGQGARVYRLWRRHPTYSEWADSPVKGVIQLYALLERLTAAAGAESTSRAATRGGFYLPDELSFAEQDAEGGGDEDSDLDIFLKDMTDGFKAAIANPASAEAMAPLTIRGPGALETANGVIPMKDAIGYFQIGPDREYAEADMWEKTIQRISYGLDLPAEMVTRTGDVNHWGGWLLDEQGFRLHIAPIVEKFCSDITAAYLRPTALRDNLPDADRVVVWYDAADAINHPDETKNALELWDRGTISDDTLREKHGYTDDQAPDEEELEQRILFLAGKTAAEEEPEGETSPAEGGRGGDTREQPPDPDENGNGRRDDREAEAQVAAARIAAAVELQVERARELAGNRLIRRSQGCDSCKQAIQNVPAPLVAAALGREQVESIINGHTTEAQLVAGAGEKLALTVRRWGVDARVAASLGQLVEQHALATLYERELPVQAVLTAAVRKVLA